MSMYTIELYKNSKRVEVQTTDEKGKAKCVVKTEDGYSYGVEVEAKESPVIGQEGAVVALADVKFFHAKISHHVILGLSDGYAAAFWDTEFKFGMQVVIRPASAK
ncbi:MAG: hypothetical protein K6D97_09160 [Clostridia bacterium]|nr:hypothetical protein [Clostridia bacterium]